MSWKTKSFMFRGYSVYYYNDQRRYYASRLPIGVFAEGRSLRVLKTRIKAQL